MAKVYSGSIYFLGQYRPAYFEATSLNKLRDQMRAAIAQTGMDDWQWFAPRIDNAVKELRKPSCGERVPSTVVEVLASPSALMTPG